MAEGNSIRDEIKAENKKNRKLPFWRKCQHIWIYYRLRILVCTLVAAMLVLLVVTLYRNNYERSFFCVIVDGKLEGTYDRTDYLTTEFTKYLGIDGKSQRVIFDNNYTFKINGISDTALYDIETLITRAGGETIDGFICEYKYALILNSDEGFFLTDLRECFSSEELEQLEDYIIYYTDKSGNKTPLSLDISSTKFITEAHVEGIERPCFGIISSSRQKENAAKFVRFLFDMEEPE